MGKLGNISGREAASAFGKAGWLVMGQVGSHLPHDKPPRLAEGRGCFPAGYIAQLSHG